MADLATRRDQRTSRELAIAVAQFLDSKRGEGVTILHVEEFLPITSYFVIASGSSSRVLQSLAEGAKHILDESAFPRLGVDGVREARWICMDYSEIVVHLFHKEAREFYDLDHLWGDAERVSFPTPEVATED